MIGSDGPLGVAHLGRLADLEFATEGPVESLPWGWKPALSGA